MITLNRKEILTKMAKAIIDAAEYSVPEEQRAVSLRAEQPYWNDVAIAALDALIGILPTGLYIEYDTCGKDFKGEEADKWQTIDNAPKSGVQILIYYKNDCGKGRIIKAKYVAKFTEESSGMNDEFGEYSEEADEYYTPEGWYEMIDNWDEYSHVAINYAPTYWQSLPAPPEGQ